MGWSVALSDDGQRLAVGAIDGGALGRGYVKIFDYVNGDWIQIGSTLSDEINGGQFGKALAFSPDGNRLAVGDTGNSEFATNAGKVSIYAFDGTDWTVPGNPIYGTQELNFSGEALAFANEGSRLAVGAFGQNAIGQLVGTVRVFDEINGTWTLVDRPIFGEAMGDESGRRIALSADGNRLVIGARTNNGAGENAGQVRIYDHINGRWFQLGLDLDGVVPGDRFGIGLSLSEDGTRMAVGATNLDTGANNSGQVKVYQLPERVLPIQGEVFYDFNENGSFDPDERPLSIGQVVLDDEILVYLNEEGFFANSVSNEVHLLYYEVPNDWQLTTDSLIYTIDPNQINITDTLCFGIAPLNITNQASVFVSGEQLICNDTIPIFFQASNVGSTIHDLELTLRFSGQLVDTDIDYDTLVDNAFSWTVRDVFPGTILSGTLWAQMPDETNLGSILPFTLEATIIDPITQLPVEDLSFTFEEMLRCAYDPNDKLVVPPGEGEEHLTLLEQTLYYTVRFQNTGNLPAENIRIRDTLDAALDASTFTFLGASHPITQIVQEDRALNFFFQDIYLPDSVNNEPESHGYINFSIQPQANLASNTVINNTAYIYFDRNAPIVTNTTVNTLVDEIVSTQNLTTNQPPQYIIYPNPSTGQIQIQHLSSDQTFETIPWQLINPMGQTLQIGVLNSGDQSLDFSTLPPGLYLLKLEELQLLKLVIARE
ncbi:MAG: T9SS type A sorting domain-containing protein [Bacteroidota bacterium]